MSQLFRYTLRLTHQTLWITLVSLAVTLSALRFWLLPNIDQLRHRLEDSLSQHLHQPIQIQHLKASLDGITPELRLIGVTIGSKDAKQLKFKEIQLGLNLHASVQTGQIQAAWVRILGAHLEVCRDQDGRFYLLGLGQGQEEGIPSWLLQDGRFELVHSTLVWHPSASKRSHTWHDTSIRLENRGTEHWLQARFEAPGVLAEQVSFSARIHGDLTGPITQWQADFRLYLKHPQPAAFVATFFPTRVAQFGLYPSSQGTLQLRGRWRQHRLEGTADLNLSHLTWQPPWLKQRLLLNQAIGRIHGRWDQTGWEIETQSLYLSNADFQTHARLRLNHSGPDSTHLEAIATLARLNLANLDAYLPRRLPAGLSRWLAHKPLQGIAQGQLLWRGCWQDFPFGDQSGSSEAWFTVQQAKIEFHPRWPALTQANLNLKLQNGHVSIEMTEGKLDTIPIETLRATLDIDAPDLVLAVRGDSRNSASNLLKVLKLSPLEPAITALTTATYLDGQTSILLSIALPLQHPEAYQIDGLIRLKQGRWHLLNQPFSLNDLSGELRFDKQQLIARLNGKFRQYPAHLEVTVDPDHARLTLSTQLDSEVLPIKTLQQYLTGSTQALLTLEIQPGRKSPPRLSLYSDLPGLAVHLPYPLGKGADQLRPLELTAWLTFPQVPLQLDYGQVHARLAVDRGTNQISGQIGLGQLPPSGGTSEGLILVGHLDRLPLDSWLALLSKQRSSPTSVMLKQLDLYTDQLQFNRRDHGPHHLKAHRLDSGWQGSLTAPYAAGNWSWQASQNLLDCELDFMALDKLQHSAQDRSQPLMIHTQLPTGHWPTLTLRIHRLQWQHRDLGTAYLKALPQPPAQIGLDLSLVGDKHHLQASGIWHTRPPSTQLSGRFVSANFGEFLKQIGHSTALVQTPTTIDFKLNWPAAPYQFSIAKLDGHIQLKMGPGRWLDIEPGAGRWLGLLYLGTLERRLRLDFSDLFQAGLAYEHIGGHIRLKDGLALTDNLTISAVSARIHIAGTLDLVNRQVDEHVTVSPNTPITLGLFGENETNVLSKFASLAQRFFNTPLDSVTQSQYAISGTLDNPNIVLLRRNLPDTLLHRLWSELKGLNE